MIVRAEGNPRSHLIQFISMAIVMTGSFSLVARHRGELQLLLVRAQISS